MDHAGARPSDADDRLHRLELMAGTVLYLSAINFVLNALIIVVAVMT